MPKVLETRRNFLGRILAAGIAAPFGPALPDLRRSLALGGAAPPLRERFRDLPRHFVFEYYPWFGTAPYRHWNQWERKPPDDIASRYFPELGAYDSGSRAVMEQHARAIADAGVGAVNVSWWGRGSYEDQLVPQLLDVLRDHGLRASFHLEPYAEDHGRRFADDVLYLVDEYGDKRGFDALLLLEDAAGRSGPVFKGFRTIVPTQSIDCHGVTRPVADFTPDGVWRRQLERLRRELYGRFDTLTCLADTVNVLRARAAGFDGIAVYDNFVAPASYPMLAAAASSAELLFSFNVNPGYDGIERRDVAPDSCYRPTPFAPPAEIDWTRLEERERAAGLATTRIRESFDATLAVQDDPALLNARRGFFLVYVNSWNEWHEGHAFEPMRDAEAVPAELGALYRNPRRGGYRLAALGERLRSLLEAGSGLSLPSPMATT